MGKIMKGGVKMKNRFFKVLAVILSVCLLVLCIGPVIGECHNCTGEDCAICRAICFVSGLLKTAAAPAMLFAGMAAVLLVILRTECGVNAGLLSNPVEMHIKILS